MKSGFPFIVGLFVMFWSEAYRYDSTCITSEITNRTTKIKNRNRAIFEETDATPRNPNNPATNATTKNMIAQ